MDEGLIAIAKDTFEEFAVVLRTIGDIETFTAASLITSSSESEDVFFFDISPEREFCTERVLDTSDEDSVEEVAEPLSGPEVMDEQVISLKPFQLSLIFIL
jgi:hypothetical protein